jgi:dihydroorotase
MTDLANQLQLRSPLDMHLHVREGKMLRRVAPCTAAEFAGAVIMPNLVPPVDNLARLQAYEAELRAAIGDAVFHPLMTLFFREYSEAELAAALPHLFAIKLYPAGATTNSEAGVQEIAAHEATFSRMEEMGIPLLVHGETAGFVLDREQEFHSVYRHLAQRFPKLRIVMEHITTAAAVSLLDEFENLFATVTLHHLIITLDDVAGGMLNPHLFCKPIAKRPEDRDALLHAALNAHPKLMFGSDSAPHPLDKKECCGCAAGVFSAPACLPMLAQLFDAHDALGNLQTFVSDTAIRVHGLTVPERIVTVEKSPYVVPESIGDVKPYRAGETLSWRVVG